MQNAQTDTQIRACGAGSFNSNLQIIKVSRLETLMNSVSRQVDWINLILTNSATEQIYKDSLESNKMSERLWWG